MNMDDPATLKMEEAHDVVLPGSPSISAVQSLEVVHSDQPQALDLHPMPEPNHPGAQQTLEIAPECVPAHQSLVVDPQQQPQVMEMHPTPGPPPPDPIPPIPPAHPIMTETPTNPPPPTATPPQLIIHSTPEEFADDLHNRLGRANGNVFHRKPGIEGIHDGQIMVRLKKKRFIVIDYGIDPEKVDIHSITTSKRVVIPPGAGREQCSAQDCSKIGVPVLLYDSVPEEPASLYLRSGLCFTCQRTLNEKRRTQRKRKSDHVENTNVVHAPNPANNDPLFSAAAVAAAQNHKNEIDAAAAAAMARRHTFDAADGYHIVVSHDGTMTKRYKINQSDDAIIIDAPPEGTKRFGDDYRLDQIGTDIQSTLQDTMKQVEELFSASSVQNVPDNTGGMLPDNTAALSVNVAAANDDSNAVAVAAAAAAAAAIAASSSLPSNDEATSAAAAVAEVTGPTLIQEGIHENTQHPNPMEHSPTSKQEISDLYDKAMLSMKKSIFLLTQWKGSYDQSSGTADKDHSNQDNSSNMIPLLLAAEAKGDNNKNNNGQNNSAAPNNAAAAAENMDVGDVEGMQIVTV